MSCNNKISNLCIDSIKSGCVDNEAELGQNTKITETCVTQTNVNKDLYDITDEIITNSDTSDLGNLCITYPLTDGIITLKTVNSVNEQEICNLKDKVTELENKDFSSLDITGFGLDFNCLVDPCGDPITTLGQLLQILINQTCNS